MDPSPNSQRQNERGPDDISVKVTGRGEGPSVGDAADLDNRTGSGSSIGEHIDLGPPGPVINPDDAGIRSDNDRCIIRIK